jgi:PadR family transcriptional regulator, regulatory protein AphA
LEYQLVNKEGRSYVDCLETSALLEDEAAALELVAACGEYRTGLLMLHAGNLPPAFYDLKSGLAGRVLLKFSNYWIKVAAVIPPELIQPGKFHEMVIETNRGNAFRVYADREEAERWLTSL